MFAKLILLAVFGIAMAHFEGVVVVYLRKALGMLDSDGNKESVEKIPKRFLYIEMTREAATIVMLVVIAWLVGTTWPERGYKRDNKEGGDQSSDELGGIEHIHHEPCIKTPSVAVPDAVGHSRCFLEVFDVDRLPEQFISPDTKNYRCSLPHSGAMDCTSVVSGRSIVADHYCNCGAVHCWGFMKNDHHFSSPK